MTNFYSMQMSSYVSDYNFSKVLRPYKCYDIFKITSFKSFQSFLELHISQTMPHKLKRGSTGVTNIKLFLYLFIET